MGVFDSVIPGPMSTIASVDNEASEANPSSGFDHVLSSLVSTQGLSDKDKDSLFKNFGYLVGMRVNEPGGPRTSMKPVAQRKPNGSPFVREVNDTITDLVTTTSECDTTYVHGGWPISTLSANSLTRPRMTNTGQISNSRKGEWTTKSFMAQRLVFDLSIEDLEPVPGFEKDVKIALGNPTTYERFQALYRVLDVWGDVLPVEFDAGVSLVVTDTTTNFIGLPDLKTLSIPEILALNTARVIKRGGSGGMLQPESIGEWLIRPRSAMEWSRIRVRRVISTLDLLSSELKSQVDALRSNLVSFSPIPTTQPLCNYESANDDLGGLLAVASVTIHSNRMVHCLALTYVNGTRSKLHGQEAGPVHEFSLQIDEHITEIIVWSGPQLDSVWIYGIQFITNRGRISKHYGGPAGVPLVLRNTNGVLAGINSLARHHTPANTQRLHDIQPIWRHDFLKFVPNQSDIFSEYVGNGNGVAFDDRDLGGKSTTRITDIEVSSGSGIHDIKVTYTNVSDDQRSYSHTAHHGGKPGPHTSQFRLDDGEHIVTISGKHNDSVITQLCFATNLGRTSDISGGGEGQPFSAKAPRSECGRPMRLQYICGKSETHLNGLMFVWRPQPHTGV